MNTLEQRIESEYIKQTIDQCDSAEDLYELGLISHNMLFVTYDTFVRGKHYIAIAGLHGCLPNYCESFETTQSAYSALLDLHEIDFLSSDASELMLSGYVELDLELHGNEYCEIAECDCNDPDQHNDS